MKATADGWRARILAQRCSGQSVRGWCRANNHHEHTFYWWRARLGLSPKPAARRRQRRPVKPLKFAEVVVDRAAAEAMCLRLGGGCELYFPRSMPVAEVAQLVRAIEGKPLSAEGAA